MALTVHNWSGLGQNRTIGLIAVAAGSAPKADIQSLQKSRSSIIPDGIGIAHIAAQGVALPLKNEKQTRLVVPRRTQDVEM
jgi:hypothetical protein